MEEDLRKKLFQEQLAQKKGAGEISRLLNGLKIKDEDNLFVNLANKGLIMTFDNEGLPMLQKPA